MRSYTSRLSGNAHKVRVLLSLLGTPVDEVEIDIFGKGARPAAFVAKTPEAKVPAVAWEDGWTLAESGALLFHLARGSPYLPEDARLQAEVLQWMFFEQNQLECSIAVIRAHRLYGEPADHELAFRALFAKGQRSLATMERHLATHAFFVGGRFTIADLMLYPYTRTAGQAGYDLTKYPHVQAWLERVEAVPGFIAFTPPVQMAA